MKTRITLLLITLLATMQKRRYNDTIDSQCKNNRIIKKQNTSYLLFYLRSFIHCHFHKENLLWK
jgi:hypothetical protein